MRTQIFHVDFQNKVVLDRFIGSERIDYYTCSCCGTKYVSNSGVVGFIPFVSWPVVVGKRNIDIYCCKQCIHSLYEAVTEDNDNDK